MTAKKEDLVVTMLADLDRALKRPRSARQWGMVIDKKRCSGCYACTVACVAEYKLPPGVVYRPVMEYETGSYPNVTREFVPRPCMQCENPPCVKGCPVNATYKREDGIVVIDYDKCIGCRTCLVNCPYGARTYDLGEFYTAKTPKLEPYETADFYEYNRKRNRKDGDSPVGNARKCHFCTNRIEAGVLPLCVTSCLGRATFFGDLKDPDALVNKVVRGRNVEILKAHLGTRPKVLYLS